MGAWRPLAAAGTTLCGLREMDDLQREMNEGREGKGREQLTATNAHLEKNLERFLQHDFGECLFASFGCAHELKNETWLHLSVRG